MTYIHLMHHREKACPIPRGPIPLTPGANLLIRWAKLAQALNLQRSYPRPAQAQNSRLGQMPYPPIRPPFLFYFSNNKLKWKTGAKLFQDSLLFYSIT
ncbi:hypothetical protein EUGRSUZ_D02036 [Eucalyptus grandis]|uniref:Uncharacterized protein n=2 Tax=Eucalyptus grandis TaxID=71139 RepID=A0ACC3LRW6_EUCGR|nr:hypothetical protein EUGRSUZ_D02036 [Eucalyptus grandis]